jgi:hypothetical protein
MDMSRDDNQLIRDAAGVGVFWWLFWLIVFAPALIVVAMVHFSRKSRAREALARRLTGQPPV